MKAGTRFTVLVASPFLHSYGAAECMQLIGGNNKEWVPDELKRIVKKIKIHGAGNIEWGVADDMEVLGSTGRKGRRATGPRTHHSWFSKEQNMELFKGGKYQATGFGRNRKLAATQDAPETGADGSSVVLQHDAPLPLGILSSHVGNCDELCHNPTTYQYSSTGDGVTVYIVDGVRPSPVGVARSRQPRECDAERGRLECRWWLTTRSSSIWRRARAASPRTGITLRRRVARPARRVLVATARTSRRSPPASNPAPPKTPPLCQVRALLPLSPAMNPCRAHMEQ